MRSGAKPSQEGKVALVSVSGIGYDRIEEASAAVDQQKANLVVFPELGFLPFEDDITPATVDAWKRFAQQKNVIVAIGVRDQGRNALKVFTPDGSVHTAYRRDGHNTPMPQTPEQARPLVLDTAFGRIGFLICDESRTKQYLDEMRTYQVETLICPNRIGSAVDQSALLAKDQGLYWCDTFYSDVLGASGGSWTHAYSVARQDVEQPTQAIAKTEAGDRYVISWHDLGSA